MFFPVLTRSELNVRDWAGVRSPWLGSSGGNSVEWDSWRGVFGYSIGDVGL